MNVGVIYFVTSLVVVIDCEFVMTKSDKNITPAPPPSVIQVGIAH